MFLGIYNKRGTGANQADFSNLLDDFSLGGKRPLEVITEGNLLIASASGSLAHESGRLLIAGCGDAYDDDPNTRSAPLCEQLGSEFTRDGDGFAPPRNGIFSFALYDAASDTLHLGNDAFGFSPLFILETADHCVFSNEIEPLALAMEGGPVLDKDAVAQFFAFWTTLGNRTLLEGVRNLEPGSILTLQRDSSSERKYDDLAIPVDRTKTFDQHVAAVAAAFEAGVRHRANQHEDVGACITGGADTRLILSCLTPEQRKKMYFETHYGVAGGESWDRDVRIGKMIAEKAGLKHEAKLIERAREPFDPSIFREYRERPPKPGELHGINGGEFMGGACVDVAIFPIEQVTRAAVDRRLGEVFEPGFTSQLSEHPYDALRREYDRLPAGNKEQHFWIKVFGRSFYTHLYNGSAGLRTSRWMVPWSFGVKIATPYMDANYLRTLMAAPFEYTTGYGIYNSIYKHHYPEFTGLPTNSNLAIRSDAALAVQLEGKEPKKDVLEPARLGRQASFKDISERGAPWKRGIYNRSYVETRIQQELSDEAAKPTLMGKLKSGYTGGLVFKLRKTLPLHKMVMNWKAKKEAAHNAQLDFDLNGALIDFEYWCEYMGIVGAGQRETSKV